MSHKRTSEFDEVPPDVLSLLGGLQPEPLELARDELFFRAGFEAASALNSQAAKSSSKWRYVWPAAAAAMLVICVGLGAATIHQSATVARLHSELAAAQNISNSSAVMQVVQSTAKPKSIEENRLFTDPFQRQMQKLASPAPLARGQLSAMGWIDMPQQLDATWENSNQGTANRPESDKSNIDSKRQESHKPATYLELLRLEQST